VNGNRENAMLRVENLKTYFPVRGGVFLTAKAQCKAVDDVSIHIGSGETLGLVGESGCGKIWLSCPNAP
jgi:ABC-type oligopeptide transport system ATPase subunit